jgi:hypothetical protein
MLCDGNRSTDARRGIQDQHRDIVGLRRAPGENIDRREQFVDTRSGSRPGAGERALQSLATV